MGGKQLRLFLADGTPGGLTTLEITNWTGRLVSAPRSDLQRLLERDEPGRPGVYLLTGDDQSALDGVRCYIGEADAIETRLREHHGTRGKDFWTRVVIVTSKDDNLTKGHTRYLEARLITIATEAKRCTLDNSTAPGVPPLPEADISDMEFFIEQLQIALPVLGVNVLRRTRAVPGPPVATTAERVTSPIFELRIPRTGITARAQQVDGEFTVLEGSQVAVTVREKETYASSTTAAYAAYRSLHQRLVDDGSIRVDGATAALTRDVVFSSPSTAGAIVSGRSCNGRQSWKTADGQTFGAWEERDLDASTV